MEEYQWLAILPAVTAIGLALITKEVITSLFLGIVVGGVVSGRYNIVNEFILPAIGSVQFATILIVYLWCLGGLIGIWTRTGGAQKFAEKCADYFVTGRRSAKFFAWLMGVVFHQGGTISTVLAGTTVRPVTDKHNVSHEELSYIVDSTAAPIAVVIPFNIWPFYIVGLTVGTIPILSDEAATFKMFYSAIPFNFYALLAVFCTLLFALEMLPWNGKKMDKAIARSKESGELDAPSAHPLVSSELSTLKIPEGYTPSIFDFLIPMLLLIGIASGSYLYSGSVMLTEAFGLAIVSAFILSIFRGLSLKEAIGGFMDGCKGMTMGAMVLALAVTLGKISQELGTAQFIVDSGSVFVVPILLPALLLLTCLVIAFSTGTSFGTFAVILPIAMPLAWSVSQDPNYIALCLASVVGGSVYGDQCSPISDTTILSSIACGADVMDHVTTQLPLATMAAMFAMILATVSAWIIL